MAFYLVKYGTAFTLEGVPLFEEGKTSYKVNPTLAAGDAKISKDGGALANLATLPAVTPAGERLVRVSLSAAELTCKQAVVQLIDAAGAEWQDQLLHLHTFGHASARYPFDFSSETVKLASQGITADTIAGGAIGAAELASSAVQEIQSGLATSANQTTFLERLTAVRAGYLDKLAITGLVASQAEVLAIQNSTRTTIALPTVMERPTSGVMRVRIYLNNYDNAGNMEEPDSAPTVGVENHQGTNRSGNLQHPTTHNPQTTMVQIENGRYWIEYELAHDDPTETLVFTFTVVEGGVTRKFDRLMLVVDSMAVDFTAADRATLNDVNGVVDTIQTKTDPLPPIPAAVGSQMDLVNVPNPAAVGVIRAGLATSSALATVDGVVDAIKAKTDPLPPNPAAEGDEMDLVAAPNPTAVTAIQEGLATSAEVAGIKINVTLGAIQVVADSGDRINSPIALEMFAEAEKTFEFGVLDANGDPVDLSGLTLRFVVQDTSDPPNGVFKLESPDIQVTGGGNEIVQITVDPTKSATASTERYWLLWNVDGSEVLAHGPLTIHPARKDVT